MILDNSATPLRVTADPRPGGVASGSLRSPVIVLYEKEIRTGVN
jgi:hypothetical protein